MTIRVGATSDQGRVRTNNEDNYALLLPPALPRGLDAVLVVADGMGGAQAGEVASGIVVKTFTAWFGSSDGPREIDPRLDLEGLLARIIQEANDAVLETARKEPSYRGMGTTVVAVVIADNRLTIGCVGDSRAYLIDAANVYQLNHDHSWVAEQVRAGHLTEAQAQRHPYRNVLTRAVGVVSDIKVETQTFDLGAGDSILLCSDGLTNLLADRELQEIVRAEPDPTRASQNLIQLANARGAPDNVTAVVARYC